MIPSKIKLSNMLGLVAAVDAKPFATILLVFFFSPQGEEIVVINQTLLESKECFSFTLYAPHHHRMANCSGTERNIIESRG
ncbi:hypothetical protein ACFX19_000751 [Malus domestica]